MKRTLLSMTINIACLTLSPYAFAACVNSSGDGVNYTCSGSTTQSQRITSLNSFNIEIDSTYISNVTTTVTGKNFALELKTLLASANNVADITVSQTAGSAVNSAVLGLYIEQVTKGSVTVSTSGDITTKDNRAISITTSSSSSTGNITVNQVSGNIIASGLAGYGISITNYGLGSVNVVQESDGNITSQNDGINISNWQNSDVFVTTSGNITAGDHHTADAISIIQVHPGNINISQLSGNLQGKFAAIYANSSYLNEDVSKSVHSITQAKGAVISNSWYGMYLSAHGSVYLDVSGSISADYIAIYGAANYLTKYYIVIRDGAVVSVNEIDHVNTESKGSAIYSTGASTVILEKGSKVVGKIILSSNYDDLLIINNGADVTEATIFDGGISSYVENSSDTNTDILNVNQSLTGSSDITSSGFAGDILLINWEQINIGSGSLDTSDTGATLSLSGDLTANSIKTNSNGVINLASTLTSATITGDVTNGGVIDLSSNSATGDILTINGNYVGSDGTLILDTKLGDDTSTTDKLVITGDASGTTYVTINKIGGTGAQTVEGIEIVEVAGESSLDAFVKNGRIVAGSYEYDVVKGNGSGTDTNNWYLSSKYIKTDTGTDTGTGGNQSTVSVIRPEAGSYIANLSSANTLFNTTLHDRIGEAQYTDFLTGEKLVTSMWLRSQIGRHKFLAGNGQLKNKTNWSLVQLGGDIAQWSSNDTNRLHLGAMAGFGRSSSDTDARLSGYSAKGSIDGYSLGLYGTWYDNDADKSGLYVDSWVLWNHFNAKVHGQELDREKYKLKGITASIESGYTFKLGGSELYNYWLQPKAQVIYMGVDADNHRESNGTKVKAGANNWQSRLGLRLSANTNDLFNSKNSSAGQLFIEANWLHNTQPFSVKMDDSRVSQDGARNIVEIKTGVEANILTNTNLWFNLAYQRGDNSYSNFSGILGVKYSF